MSPTRPPARRPQPPAVYRRRRLMVAGTAVLLVVAVVDLANGDDGAAPADTVARVVSTPTAEPSTASRATTVGPSAGKRRTRKPAAPATTAPAPEPAEPDGPCSDADVTVRPEVGRAVAGSRVPITLVLSTRTAEACTWTLGPDHLAYRITDDEGDVWASNECPSQVPDATVVVRRDLLSTYTLRWNGRLSSPACPGSMPDADPGTYDVQAAALGGEPSEPVEFTLADPDEVAKDSGPAVPKTSTGTKKTTKTTKTKR